MKIENDDNMQREDETRYNMMISFAARICKEEE